MKNKNVFIWGLGALLVTTYSALASDITSHTKSMTSIAEGHSDSISSVIEGRPDSVTSHANNTHRSESEFLKGCLQRGIKLLKIPYIIVFDKCIDNETGELKEDYVKTMDDATNSICKDIEMCNNIELFRTKLPYYLQGTITKSSTIDISSEIDLIAGQIVKNEIITNQLKKSLKKIDSIKSVEQLKQFIIQLDGFLETIDALPVKDGLTLEKQKYLNSVIKKIENLNDQEAKDYIKEYRKDLTKYQKILNKQHECLYRVKNALASDSTLEEAIEEIKDNQKPYNPFIALKYYKDTDADTNCKNFYSLDFGILD